MAMNMKTLGVRVPEESSIPERLRARALETRMSYYELIEQWLDRDDREKAEGLNLAAPQEDSGPGLEARLEELRRVIIDDIDARIAAVVEERISRILGDRDAETPKPNEELNLDGKQLIERIKTLKEEGVSLK
jgi:hypothetical protein